VSRQVPGTVVIDVEPPSMARYADGWAVVAIDVVRATTTAVTAVATGRRCFPVGSLDDAVRVHAKLDNAILAGELGGAMPFGFDENNSPVALLQRQDTERPVVLLSTSGTQLLADVRPREALYAACLRNVAAQVDHLAGRHDRVAVIGAGTRGEFREEDQLCCAWIAEGLIGRGYQPERTTAEIVARWSGAPLSALATGASARYLLASGQRHDLDFVLSHHDDLNAVFAVEDGELLRLTDGSPPDDGIRPTTVPTGG
jgi:2-phosphosulfolactate phosphatase